MLRFDERGENRTIGDAMISETIDPPDATGDETAAATRGKSRNNHCCRLGSRSA